MPNFDSLWEEFSIPLKVFIKRRVNQEQDVEDILQMVFIKIYHNLDSLNQSSKLHAWIYTITKNTIVDYYRTHKQDLSISDIIEDITIEEVEEETFNHEIAQCLHVMIKRLPEIYKQAIILTEYENLTQKELAWKMGLSISGAKSRVQRARRLLKDMLLNCCDMEFDCNGNVINYHHKNKDCKYC